MRKDLRIGLAIGLVLLAVLVVYLLIPGGNDAKRRNAANQASSQQTGGAAAEGHNDATGTGGETENTAPTEPPPADGPGPGTAPEKSNTPAKDQSDVFAGGPPTSSGTDATAGNTASGGNPKPATGTTETNNTDWANLLYAPLRTTTPPGGDNAAQGSPQNQRQATGRNDQAGVSFKQPQGNSDRSNSAPAAARTHTIQAGENFSKIAEAVYGSQRYASAIAQANPTIDPSHLKIGDQIKLPDRAEVTRGGEAAAKAAEQPINEATEYRVQAGDSLHKIAVKRFGSVQKADEIYELNRDKIGPDPARLKVNMVLKMPAGGTNNGNGNSRAEADREGDAQTAGSRAQAGR